MGTASNLHDIKHLDKILCSWPQVALLQNRGLARNLEISRLSETKTASRASAQRSQKTTGRLSDSEVRQNTESTDGGHRTQKLDRGFTVDPRGVLSGFMSIRRGHRIARAKRICLCDNYSLFVRHKCYDPIGGYAALPRLTFSCSSGTL